MELTAEAQRTQRKSQRVFLLCSAFALCFSASLRLSTLFNTQAICPNLVWHDLAHANLIASNIKNRSRAVLLCFGCRVAAHHRRASIHALQGRAIRAEFRAAVDDVLPVSVRLFPVSVRAAPRAVPPVVLRVSVRVVRCLRHRVATDERAAMKVHRAD